MCFGEWWNDPTIPTEQEIWANNEAEALESVIKQGLPPTFRNSEGITLLQQACERRSEGSLQVLIRVIDICTLYQFDF